MIKHSWREQYLKMQRNELNGEALFDELGIHYYKSEANFIFFEAPDADADGLADAWLTEGYQVRRGQRDGWLRLTIPMAQDGDVMRHILKQFVNK